MNVFRVLADLSHVASVCVLITSIHRNRSAEGVSYLTQILYTVVFCCRYLDLIWVPPSTSWWNTIFKIFFISSSAYILYLMRKVYPRTKEKEYAWKLATGSLAACVISAPLLLLVFKMRFTTFEVLWAVSIELESVCVLPQLLLLRQTSVPTVINSYYLVMLGSYRFLYLLNWLVRAINKNSADPMSIIFGIVQTALYADFAWVYFSRQRVKLRGGHVVDSEDLSKSFLVRRLIGRGTRADRESIDGEAEDDDGGEAGLRNQENGVIGAGGANTGRSWGARGISVSADDTLHDHQRGGAENTGAYADSGAGAAAAATSDAQMIDPAHFEDEEIQDDADAPPPPVAKDDKFKKADGDASKGDGVENSSAVWAENEGNGTSNS